MARVVREVVPHWCFRRSSPERHVALEGSSVPEIRYAASQ